MESFDLQVPKIHSKLSKTTESTVHKTYGWKVYLEVAGSILLDLIKKTIVSYHVQHETLKERIGGNVMSINMKTTVRIFLAIKFIRLHLKKFLETETEEKKWKR